MEKLFCKKGITISLRCLLIVASLVFGSSANVWAEDLTTTFNWAGSATAAKGTTDYVVTQSPVKLTFSLGTASNAPRTNKEGSVRMYAGTQLTISLEGDYVIKQVDFTPTTKSYNATKLKFNGTSLTSDSWVLSSSEQAASVTLNASEAARFKKIVVTYASTSSGGGETTLIDRELSFGETKSFDAEVGGTFSAPELKGVTDGVTYASSNVDVASVDANGAVTINGMGLAKITASAEANATYKAGSASYDIYVYGKGTIEDLKAYITSTTETDIYFNFTSTAVVTYAATNYAYMEDGHAGIYLYKKGHGLKAGNSFTGKVIAKGKLYNQLYEFTDFPPASAAGTADITATNWTIQELTGSKNAGYKMAESMRVKLTGVTATSSATGTSCTIEQGGASTSLALYNSLSVTAGGVYDITGYPYNNDGTWEFRVYEESCLEQTGSKTVATVTFAQESYTVETNGSITVSATTNSTAAIVYSISPADGNVSIDVNTGKILAGATAGTYTITATVAENNDFTSASATCPLTVTAPAPPSYNITAPTYYKKITSTDELAVGGTYLIVCERAKYGLTSIAASATYTQGDNNTITNEIAATLGEFELVKTNENYNNEPLYELLVDGSYLYSPNATKTDISMQASESENTKWLVRFDDDGNVEIDSYCTFSDASKTNRGLIYQNSGQVIKHYAVSNRGESGYLKVQLYQKVTDLAISTLTNGYATFVTDVPYVMPKGACGYAVTVAPQAGVITKTEAYTEGQKVPAQTALLIGGASGTNYYPAVLKEDVAASYKGDNYMEGARTAKGFTSSLRGGDVYYYKLALNSASKPKPGFYYGATDGAAFQLTKPTTAYLAVPKSIKPVNGYLIDFEDETTGIDSIGQTDSNANGAIYNLNGIRMAQPLRNLPKGVYVVNGKKVIRF